MELHALSLEMEIPISAVTIFNEKFKCSFLLKIWFDKSNKNL